MNLISNSISPDEFYNKYVKTRIPVIIDGHLTDKEWKGSSLWTNNYLKEKVGDHDVQVEMKNADEKGFGKGSITTLPFTSFITDLDRNVNSTSSLYLSTQELRYSEDGKPDLISAPVTCLVSDIPSRPVIMGNLIPQNVNLWMGASLTETSSGLHHDYHDNLYILLRGKKRFLLLPPSCAADMYTVGTVDKIHPNGRINYVGQLPTMSDGSAVKSNIALKASATIDEAATRLEKVNYLISLCIVY